MSSNLKRLALHIRGRKLQGRQPYHLLLMPLAQTSDVQQGYLHLAWLLQEGYFKTVVTFNHDTSLEHMLYGAGIQAMVLDVNKDTAARITEALEEPPPGICIIKLYHSDPTEVQSAGNTPLMADELYTSLQSYLQNILVIVGSVHQEDGLVQICQSVTAKSIYYVLPQPPAIDDVIEQMRQTGKPNIFTIRGPCGEFTTFFAALASFCQQGSATDFPPCLPDDIEPNHQRMVVPEYRLPEVQAHQKVELQPTVHLSSTYVLKKSAIVQLNSKMKTDVLLTTATPIETKAVLELFPEHQQVRIRKKIYYDLGSINGLQIVLVQQPHMGSSGNAGSHISIKEAIEALSPLYVIMVGIAFGIDSRKQNIGDILISRHLQDYDPLRASSGPDKRLILEPRGDRVMASTHLLDLFMAGHYALSDIWPVNPPKVEFGLILSGSKLVDHEDYRDELRNVAPDAIGGEMEGIGLYHAASEKRVHWIVVKAICDWADGNKHAAKDERQQLAARNAAMFTHYVLQRGGFDHHRPKRKTATDK